MNYVYITIFLILIFIFIAYIFFTKNEKFENTNENLNMQFDHEFYLKNNPSVFSMYFKENECVPTPLSQDLKDKLYNNWITTGFKNNYQHRFCIGECPITNTVCVGQEIY